MPRFTYLKYSDEHYMREIFEKYVLKLKMHSVKWSQNCIIVKKYNTFVIYIQTKQLKHQYQ